MAGTRIVDGGRRAMHAGRSGHTNDQAGGRSSSQRLANAGLWVVQVVLAGMFLMSAYGKLSGAPEMVALFDAVGLGQWFRYFTGVSQLVGALLLLTPLAAAGGALLAVVMAGAVLTHLFIIGGSFTVALLLMVGALAVARGRRARLQAQLQRALARR